MSKDFEWKTGEETLWDEPGGEQPAAQSADLRAWLKRWWRWLALAAVLLLIVVGIVYTVLNRRVQLAEEQAAADVLATHSLLLQAASERDFDLLDAVSSDRSDWSELQLDLLNVGLFLDRRPLNLKINLDRAAQESPDVTLSPDLQTAEVVQQFPYEVSQIVNGETITQTIHLEHTFRYQRQDESWLFAPIPGNQDFWGSWQNSEEGSYVTIIYPQREEAFVPFLLDNFDALIEQICQDEAIGCPFNFKLEIRLDRSPASLERLNLSVFDTAPIANGGRYHFSLPAPTLIGRPIDEAGSESLYQGYANWLAAVMAFRYAEGAFVRDERLIEERLVAWGLERPPDPQQPVPFPQTIPQPPVPFPEQDILLACVGFGEMMLLRYDPRANRWFDELDGRPISYLSSPTRGFPGSFMTPLPDDSGILMSVTNFDGEAVTSQLVSWRDGEERLLLKRDFMIQLLQEPFQQHFDPTGRKYIILDVNYIQNANGQDVQLALFVLDLEECLAGECDPQLYGSYPYWSPDLSWALLVALEEQNHISLREERTGEEISLGDGFSPFWLDNESVIYIRAVEDTEAGTGAIETVEIVAATVDDPLDGRVLVDSTAISTAVTGNDPTVPVGIHSVTAHPQQPDWLFITVTLSPFAEPQTRHILSFRGDTGELTVLMDLEDSLNFFFQIVADGQLAAVHSSGDNVPSDSLTLIPLDPAQKTAGAQLETLTTNGIFNLDWSQDGRWLLVAGQETIRLIAPGHNYDHAIPHDNSACTTAAWVNATD